ncbi:MAG: hypothetical protein RLZZ08_2003 [Pseudomonadota bacterium]|jgi:drug/metabolite transporter superfamily protein YnfA
MDTLLSIVVLAALALVAGAIFLWRRGERGKQVWLMLLMALVLVGNVLIWTVPDADGTVPMDHAATR